MTGAIVRKTVAFLHNPSTVVEINLLSSSDIMVEVLLTIDAKDINVRVDRTSLLNYNLFCLHHLFQAVSYGVDQRILCSCLPSIACKEVGVAFLSEPPGY